MGNKNFHDVRNEFLFSQKQLAEFFDVSRSMVNQVERVERTFKGKAAASYAMLQTVLKEFRQERQPSVLCNNELITLKQRATKLKKDNKYWIVKYERDLEALTLKFADIKKAHKRACTALHLVDSALKNPDIRNYPGLEIFLETHRVEVVNKLTKTDSFARFKLQRTIALLKSEITFRKEMIKELE